MSKRLNRFGVVIQTAKPVRIAPIGSRWRWKADGKEGEVIAADYNSFKIRWSDGIISIFDRVYSDIEQIGGADAAQARVLG
jgi:hypothetical protein